LEELTAGADVVITATSASEPLIRASLIRPGTHIAAIGADTKGKQELDAEIVARAAVYVDSIDQAVAIGECQHAFAAGLLRRGDIRGTLGGLITGRDKGRTDDREITLFDSTGIALQDIAVAALAVRRKRAMAPGILLSSSGPNQL
jgi:ornithine cyclodeaminase